MKLACPNNCHSSLILQLISSFMDDFVDTLVVQIDARDGLFNLDHNISDLNIFVDHYWNVVDFFWLIMRSYFSDLL